MILCSKWLFLMNLGKVALCIRTTLLKLALPNPILSVPATNLYYIIRTELDIFYRFQVTHNWPPMLPIGLYTNFHNLSKHLCNFLTELWSLPFLLDFHGSSYFLSSEISCLHGRAVIRSPIEPVENSVVFIRLMVNWTFQSCQLISVLTVSQTDRQNTATLDTPSTGELM